MYKTETHLHTSDSSVCGKIPAAELIRLYHEAGYSTVFVTDHVHKKGFRLLGDIPWEEKVSIYFAGYYRAKYEGDKLGVTVLPAAEITIKPNHYLAYGVTRDFLLAYPDIYELSIEEFYAAAKKHGVFIVQAHPHRDGKCYPTPEYVDAIEVYNSSPNHADFSEKSEAVAREYGLLVSAGSDTHKPEEVALSGVMSENKINTAEDFIALIRSGKAQIIR